MSEEKKINLGINDGTEFFAHELSLNFNPAQFIFDFKCITPRIDPRSAETPFISLKHNVIMVEPYHAKRILEVLTNVVNDYEKKFGKIEMPKALQKYAKEIKKIPKKKDNTVETMPNYFG